MKTLSPLFCTLFIATFLSINCHATNLDALAAKKTALITKMHKKAKKAIVNAAKDKAFTAYFHTHDHGEKKHLKSRIEEISLHVQSKFAVEEMCLIDANGPELTRIVGREIAHDLSPDESGAIFFAPGLKLSENEGYVSPIYFSPDANRLVVAYVTPIVTEHKNVALLHYEHGLDAYQKKLNTKLPDNVVVLALNQEGYIVSDSRNELKIDGESEDISTYLKKLENHMSVIDNIKQGQAVELNGKQYQGALRNVEHWTILVLMPS